MNVITTVYRNRIRPPIVGPTSGRTLQATQVHLKDGFMVK